ncbi:MAG TPA: CoA transferase [Bryobacteraceae bacterium]|nr:CoA transferase [Bryobacteraceae bacterium]
MPSALDGLTVLDFSHALAGPYCTMLLAQYGARVYKIESATGDTGRTWAPPFTGGQASYFIGVNAGKKGVLIDLKRPEGLDLALRLVEKADVLIENMRPGTMDRLGLDYRKVQARNPRLIYCAISGYGQNGPRRDEPAMDLILQASCGLISVTGSPGGEPARCGHSVADITAGMFALIGILMALNARHTTNLGQFVDVSMFDSMISAMASNFAYYVGSGIVAEPMGTAFATIVPYRTFPTADRHIAIAVGSEKLWPPFCKALERPDLASMPAYSTNALRVKNRAVLEPLLTEIFARHTAEEWSGRLGARGVPNSPVRTIDEVFADPQSAVRHMFEPVIDSAGAEFKVTGCPVKLAATPGAVRGPAPHLGEHTKQALRDLLELNGSDVERLAASGVIVQAAG